VDERGERLSEQATTILGLIAEGRSYDQILHHHPDLTYFDIFAAAREALELAEAPGARTASSEPAASAPVLAEIAPVNLVEVAPIAGEPIEAAPSLSALSETFPAPADVAEAAPMPTKRLPAHIEKARATHRRAWARWTRDEDARLTALFGQGDNRAEMVRELERQPGAIRNRLLKLGLISEAEGDDAADGPVGADRPLAASAPGQADADGQREPEPRAAPEPSASPVPGWDELRDRLSPDR
jgi:hypothetical protein